MNTERKEVKYTELEMVKNKNITDCIPKLLNSDTEIRAEGMLGLGLFGWHGKTFEVSKDGKDGSITVKNY